MDKARIRADIFRDIRQECDHIVLRLFFDLKDSLGIERCFLANTGCRAFGYDAELFLFFASKQLDLEPDLESVLVSPNIAHFRASITWDHAIVNSLSNDRNDIVSTM